MPREFSFLVLDSVIVWSDSFCDCERLCLSVLHGTLGIASFALFSYKSMILSPLHFKWLLVCSCTAKQSSAGIVATSGLKVH